MVDTVHIDAMLTAGLHLPARDSRLTWYWPDIDVATDRGTWTVAELLAQADQRRHELTTDIAGRVGAMLLAENRRSVDHRYDEQELEEPYLFTRLTGTADPVVVLNAINCYEYQSCEHAGWRSSEAHAFCRALRALTIGYLPGYDRAPCEVTDRQAFTAAAVTARAARGHRSSR